LIDFSTIIFQSLRNHEIWVEFWQGPFLDFVKFLFYQNSYKAQFKGIQRHFYSFNLNEESSWRKKQIFFLNKESGFTMSFRQWRHSSKISKKKNEMLIGSACEKEKSGTLKKWNFVEEKGLNFSHCSPFQNRFFDDMNRIFEGISNINNESQKNENLPSKTVETFRIIILTNFCWILIPKRRH